MDFLTLQKELGVQCGMDYTISEEATLLKRWLNNSQQQIMRAFEWPFARSITPLVVQTVTDYTTGTVATTAGSTSVTFSAPITNSKTGQYLQTSSSNDWYKITSHTAGTATATLEIGAIYTASADTFTIRKKYYSTSSAVDRIIQIFQDVLPYQLAETSPEYFQAFNPGFLSTGTPRVFLPSGLDSSGYVQFQLWPSPDAVVNLAIVYQQAAVDMSADSDVSIIPAKWHTTVLLEGAKAQAYSALDDARFASSLQFFNAGIEEMKLEYEVSLHRHRIMTAIDNQPIGGAIGYLPLPFYYPRGS